MKALLKNSLLLYAKLESNYRTIECACTLETRVTNQAGKDSLLLSVANDHNCIVTSLRTRLSSIWCSQLQADKPRQHNPAACCLFCEALPWHFIKGICIHWRLLGVKRAQICPAHHSDLDMHRHRLPVCVHSLLFVFPGLNQAVAQGPEPGGALRDSQSLWTCRCISKGNIAIQGSAFFNTLSTACSFFHKLT